MPASTATAALSPAPPPPASRRPGPIEIDEASQFVALGEREVQLRLKGLALGVQDFQVAGAACELRRRHPRPGDIRELQNAIEQSLITSEGTLVTGAHLALRPSPPAATVSTPGSLDEMDRAKPG